MSYSIIYIFCVKIFLSNRLSRYSFVYYLILPVNSQRSNNWLAKEKYSKHWRMYPDGVIVVFLKLVYKYTFIFNR